MARILSLLFLVAATVVAVAFNATKPRVLILHSYQPNYAWTRDVNVGVERVARKWSDYSVRWHYMDTQQTGDKDGLRRAGIAARRAIDRFDPQVLIAVDDAAQDLAGRHYVERKDMDIIFAGVNGSVTSYGYDGAQNVTGVFERRPLEAVREMILAIEQQRGERRAAPVLLYLMDPSPSVARDREFVAAFDWSPVEFQGAIVVEDFAHWREQVLALSEMGVDYLLVANYRALPRDKDDPSFPTPREVMEWTEEHSPVPVIGVNVFNVEDGGAIALGPSPFEQGEVAARLAETLLEQHLHGEALPRVINRHYVVAMNAKALARRGLKLPRIYETFARTTATYLGDGP